nr:DUF5990 family protein [Micromonospora sp. DSM 115978]
VQRRSDVVEVHPADAADVSWSIPVTAFRLADGGVDLRGPYVQGRLGGRFLYLSWGEQPDGPGTGFAMFRRAKLMFDAVPAETLSDVVESGGVLVGRLGLTDARGMPLCAAVRPPVIVWSVEGPP